MSNNKLNRPKDIYQEAIEALEIASKIEKGGENNA